MCAPIAGIAFTAVAGALTAYSQYSAGRAASKQARYNAQIEEQKRKDALVRGEQEVGRLRDDVNREAARARVRAAASGIDIGFGSPADVLATAEMFRESDVNLLRANAAREAWGYRVQAVDWLNRGEIAKATGQNQAIGTVISSGSDIYQQGRGYYWS